MEVKGMVIDHIGIAVNSMERAIEHWEKVFGYRQHTEIITNTRQKVRVVFLEKAGSITIKLIEPVDSDSSNYNFVKRGGGIHHLCFKCENMDSEIVKLKQLGLRILVEPQPGEAFESENISFIFAKNGLNIELIDTDKKTGIIKSGDQEQAEKN